MEEYKGLVNWKAIQQEIILDSVAVGSKNYLFKDQMEKTQALIRDFSKENKNISNRENNRSASVIGILGERGSGKSSFLGTLKNVLNAQEQKYFVLDVIDPNDFDNRFNILEMFLAKLYNNLPTDDDQREVAMFMHKIEIAMGTLADMRVLPDRASEMNSALELLEQTKQRLNFKQDLKGVVENFLRIQKKEQLVICIDDIDLVENNIVYQMLEDIRKNFSDNIIVVLAYRHVQLKQSVLEEKIISEKNLLSKRIVDVKELEQQVDKYLEKLIPLENRVELLVIKEYDNIGIQDLLQNIPNIGNESTKGIKLKTLCERYNKQSIVDRKEDDKEDTKETIWLKSFTGKKTVKQWIIDVIYLKTRLRVDPVDQTENTIYNFPTNLRGLLQLLELLDVELIEVDDNDKEKEKEFTSNLIKNIETYKRYFIREVIEDSLETKNKKIINEWLGLGAEVKNYYLYSCINEVITKKLGGENEAENKYILNNLLDIQNMVPQNITIGDVYEIIELYKRVLDKSGDTIFFVYSIKVLYSIELLLYYVKQKNEDKNSSETELESKAEMNNVAETNKEENDEEVEFEKTEKNMQKLQQEKKYLYQYLTLINGKITPTNFVPSKYGEQVYYIHLTEKLLLRFDTASEEMVEKEENKNPISVEKITEIREKYKEIIDAITSGTVSKGRGYKSNAYAMRHRKLEENKEINNFRTTQEMAIKYRRFFHYFSTVDEIETAKIINKNRQLVFDIYAQLTKRAYLERNRTIFTGQYIFYSMFDLDKLVRINYDNKSKTPEIYMFRKINETFNKEVTGSYNNPFEGYLYNEETPEYIDNFAAADVYKIIGANIIDISFNRGDIDKVVMSELSEYALELTEILEIIKNKLKRNDTENQKLVKNYLAELNTLILAYPENQKINVTEKRREIVRECYDFIKEKLEMENLAEELIRALLKHLDKEQPNE